VIKSANPAPATDDDADSTPGESLASSTNSRSTSILEYQTIQGRMSHSDRTPAEYWCVPGFMDWFAIQQ
jgi:hypothetical protein